MICPHCRTTIHPSFTYYPFGKDADGDWAVGWMPCPSCGRFIVILARGTGAVHAKKGFQFQQEQVLARPKGVLRPACPAEVPADLAEDYNEAAAVIADSPKASAALTRRALQHLLRDYAGVKPGNLQGEIQEAIDSGKVPPYIGEQLDAVRNIGNFAAHPTKSKQSGEVVPVEAGEAEWNLDVLDSLFEFFFVGPARAAERRAALNAKLKEAGKPELP